MAIEFVEETGSGLANATTYVTLTYFNQFWENRGVIFTETDDEKKAWLNLATAYIDTHYTFFGDPSNGDVQALLFPRTGLRNSRKRLIDEDEMPTELKNATCLLAKECQNNINLDEEVDDGVKSKKMGPVSVTFKDGYSPDYKQASNFLRYFIKKYAALGVVS